jgi:hypothetical protein
MRPQEADWIRAALMSRGADEMSPIAHVGSQTLEFRTRKKPHIENSLFRPLRQAGYRVVNIDIQEDAGVDVAGDLTDPAFVATLKTMGFRSVICANLLEHLADRGPLSAALVDIVAEGGRVVLTVPYSYPYHPDPIDTLYRPSPADLAEAFPRMTLVKGEVLVDGTLRNEAFAGGLVAGLRYFTMAGLRMLNVARPRIALAQLHRMLWLFRSFKVSCVVLEKAGRRA